MLLTFRAFPTFYGDIKAYAPLLYFFGFATLNVVQLALIEKRYAWTKAKLKKE